VTTVISAAGAFEIKDALIYPDPVSGAGDFTLRLSCTRQPVSVSMKIYSVSFRLIRDLSWDQSGMTGNYDMAPPAGCLDNCANGTYFYEISAVGDDGKTAKSTAKPLIIIR